MDQQIPNWRPDWKDATAYPASCDALIPEEWAWEFLRRNPEYQEYYYQPETGWFSAPERFGILLSAAPHESYGSIMERHSGPPFSGKHLLFETAKGVPYAVCTGIGEDGEPTLKRGNGFCSGDYLTILSWTPILPDGTPGKSLGPSAPSPQNLGEAVALFDLTAPLEPQIEAITKKLKHERDVLKKKGVIQSKAARSSVNYPLYLRVLDADAAGASIGEIARELLPESDVEDAKQNVRNWLRAARTLATDGYRNIPYPRSK